MLSGREMLPYVPSCAPLMGFAVESFATSSAVTEAVTKDNFRINGLEILPRLKHFVHALNLIKYLSQSTNFRFVYSIYDSFRHRFSYLFLYRIA